MPRNREPPRPQRPAEELRAERRVRALETPLDIRWRPDPRFVRLEVRNPVHRTRYEVLLPAFPEADPGFCTCTDFAKRGIGTCKHLEAVRLWLEDHPGEVSRLALPRGTAGRATWAEIDRRLRPSGRPRALDARRLRYPGAVLLGSAPKRAP
ncbi:MAG TPA: hypothetical protein VIZ68_08115 [Thermoplasmata archaeon]